MGDNGDQVDAGAWTGSGPAYGDGKNTSEISRWDVAIVLGAIAGVRAVGDGHWIIGSIVFAGAAAIFCICKRTPTSTTG
ncbi:hypothetical protein LMIY3S_01773 [Labrys miyagiensis]